MGQVWSKADFDGIDEAGSGGFSGRGSVLAVTSQNLGNDGLLGTADDVLAPLNARPVHVSIDKTPGPSCRDQEDRIRNFTSFHAEGAFFVYGDGSVHFVSNTIEPVVYQAMGSINGNEPVTAAE